MMFTQSGEAQKNCPPPRRRLRPKTSPPPPYLRQCPLHALLQRLLGGVEPPAGQLLGLGIRGRLLDVLIVQLRRVVGQRGPGGDHRQGIPQQTSALDSLGVTSRQVDPIIG